MLGMLLSAVVLLLASAVQPVAANRSEDMPICDYYARNKYGENNKTTQLKLMASIVALAYAGGNGLNASHSDNTGIFGYGSFQEKPVRLAGYFDGTKQTANFNGNPSALNFLDGGGVNPLTDYLNGSSSLIPDIKQGTNQYTLFTHWYVAFGRIYGCSKAEEFLDKKYRTLTPAYVHKYMNLQKHEIGYFIHQLILASSHFGFAAQDADTLETLMNSRYNLKCKAAENGTLTSICLNNNCPLAVDKPDCKAYDDIKQYAGENTAPPTPGATGTSSASPPSDGGKSDLGGGAIAGIAIGAFAGLSLIIGTLWFFFRKRRGDSDAAQRPDSLAVSQTTGGYHNPPAMYSPAMTTQTPFEQGSPVTTYDPSRQSQFTFFSQGRDSHVAASSPPPPGWTEMAPQELDAAELGPSRPTSPGLGAVSGSQTKTGYKPDLHEAFEMESPPPRLDARDQTGPHEGEQKPGHGR